MSPGTVTVENSFLQAFPGNATKIGKEAGHAGGRVGGCWERRGTVRNRHYWNKISHLLKTGQSKKEARALNLGRESQGIDSLWELRDQARG